jgi:hypothetical protein
MAETNVRREGVGSSSPRVGHTRTEHNAGCQLAALRRESALIPRALSLRRQLDGGIDSRTASLAG